MNSDAHSDAPDLDYGPTLRGLREGQKVFGRYQLIRLLGRGGMGVVWLTRDSKLDLEIALKFLPENLVHDEVALDDLRRETKRCLKLTHQNIVRIYDLVDDERTAAIAMEFVDGKPLSTLRLERENRVFEAEHIAPWIKTVCEALQYAHEECRVVHRDLKPANILVTREGGRAKIADFGVARSLSDSMSRVSAQSTSGGGTLVYMSPQQAAGAQASVADDTYSMGAMIYELLTSKPPFHSGNIQHQIENITPVSMTERRAELGVENAQLIPAAWEQTVAACLEKEPERRPRSAAEVWTHLSSAALGALAFAPAAAKPARAGAKTEVPAKVDERPHDNKPHETAAHLAGRKPLLIAAAVVIAGVSIWLGTSKKPEPANATKDAPFVNTLGMKFVPVPGTKVLFCIHDTRKGDYRKYAAAKSGVDTEWENVEYLGVPVSEADDHPVVNVSWEDAKAFCSWLSDKEGRTYRLPSDHEWSVAVGIGEREDATTSPESKAQKIADVYPWGSVWPPPKGTGNFGDSSAKEKFPDWTVIEGYTDGYATTSPVMSFTPHMLGLYDMSGNVWQWCEDWYNKEQKYRVLRGGSWDYDHREGLLSSNRSYITPGSRTNDLGFRCVVVVGGGSP